MTNETMPPMPNEWVPWFDYHEDGFISDAGVDTKDRASNVCVTTCENIEVDDQELYNRIVIRDTNLIAAAPNLLSTCETLLGWLEDNSLSVPSKSQLLKFIDTEVRAVVAKAKGETSASET